MRKIAWVILLAVVLSTGAEAVTEGRQLDKRECALLCRAMAQSYPEEPYAALVGMAAVVLNRMDRDGIGCAEAVEAMAAEGAFPGMGRLAAAMEEKRYRLAGDAVEAALSGADPTSGAMHFRRFAGDAGWAADLNFNDEREDREQSQILSQASGCPVLIGGIGFW